MSPSVFMEWDSTSEGKQVIPEQCFYPNDLDITIPVSSFVSPAFFEGLHGQGISVNSGTGIVTNLGEARFFVDQPLSADSPRGCYVTGGGKRVDGKILWTPTLLDQNKSLTVRQHDSVLFKAVKAGLFGVGLNSGTYLPLNDVKENEMKQVKFDSSGFYEVTQSFSDGTYVVVSVSVPSVIAGGSIAVATQYNRIKDIKLVESGFKSLVTWYGSDKWTIIDPLISQTNAPDIARIGIKSEQNRPSYLIGRINGSNGPIIAYSLITPFILRSTAEKTINVKKVFPDGSKLCNASLTMTPLVPGLRIKLYAYVSGITFEDSTTVKWLDSENFVKDIFGGHFDFNLIKAPGLKTGVCHNKIAYQDGVQVSP